MTWLRGIQQIVVLLFSVLKDDLIFFFLIAITAVNESVSMALLVILFCFIKVIAIFMTVYYALKTVACDGSLLRMFTITLLFFIMI